jgi:hypothetical protein
VRALLERASGRFEPSRLMDEIEGEDELTRETISNQGARLDFVAFLASRGLLRLGDVLF